MTPAEQSLYEDAVETIANNIAYATALAWYSEGEDVEDGTLEAIARANEIDTQIEIVADMFHAPLSQVQNDIMSKAGQLDIQDYITAVRLRAENRLS